jgi:3-hexulose-6-phosphate synthase
VDTLNIVSAMRIADQVHPHYDILEIGTPLIIEEGLRALEAIKNKYPDKLYLADVKIMDAGLMEAESAFKRGADIVTVLAVADNRTLQGSFEAAEKYKGQIMVDLINAPDPATRAQELESLGVDIICVHTAHDSIETGHDPLWALKRIRDRVQCRLAIAGGLNLEHVKPAIGNGANILVVGSSITSSPAPGDAAAMIAQRIREVCK